MPDSIAALGRVQRLLVANRLVVEHLELAPVLRQIVEAATELVGAAYGAIGTQGPDGRLEEFIHVGLPADVVARIGHPPVGLGLLSTSLEPQPVRVASMQQDPRSIGFPPHHPAMSSFLGVPVRVRKEVYGHLYLADPRSDVFTHADQELVEALAATAGVAIAHARLFQESTRREQWTAASAEITRLLLTDDAGEALDLIAQRALELAGADLVAVVVPVRGDDPDGDLLVERAVGNGHELVAASVIPRGDGIVARCLRTALPQRLARIPDSHLRGPLPPSARGPVMALPLPGSVGVRGSLLVTRAAGAALFTDFDLEVAASFAGQAALALDRADVRLLRVETDALQDRDRIGRDLHDHVVQRLFAAGLNIQSVAVALGPGPQTDRLGQQIDEIDATIRQIRQTIFGLHAHPLGPGRLRAQVLAVIASATVLLPAPPDVIFRGPLDVLVPAALYADVLAVVREALTNVGRHAEATHVSVTLSADPGLLSIRVLDDGIGIRATAGDPSGLSNLRSRVKQWGGWFEVGDRQDGPGTSLVWTVSLRDRPEPSSSDQVDPHRHHGDVAPGVLDHGRRDRAVQEVVDGPALS